MISNLLKKNSKLQQTNLAEVFRKIANIPFQIIPLGNRHLDKIFEKTTKMKSIAGGTSRGNFLNHFVGNASKKHEEKTFSVGEFFGMSGKSTPKEPSTDKKENDFFVCDFF